MGWFCGMIFYTCHKSKSRLRSKIDIKIEIKVDVARPKSKSQSKWKKRAETLCVQSDVQKTWFIESNVKAFNMFNHADTLLYNIFIKWIVKLILREDECYVIRILFRYIENSSEVHRKHSTGHLQKMETQMIMGNFDKSCFLSQNFFLNASRKFSVDIRNMFNVPKRFFEPGSSRQ